jgi:hypothetical protein
VLQILSRFDKVSVSRKMLFVNPEAIAGFTKSCFMRSIHQNSQHYIVEPHHYQRTGRITSGGKGQIRRYIWMIEQQLTHLDSVSNISSGM